MSSSILLYKYSIITYTLKKIIYVVDEENDRRPANKPTLNINCIYGGQERLDNIKALEDKKACILAQRKGTSITMRYNVNKHQ